MPMLLTKLMAAGLGSGLANAFCADTADNQTATGTNQATAFETSTAFVRFTTVASGTGCLLDNGARGDSQFIINAGANALSVYPHVGGTINQLAINAAFSIPAGSWASFDRYTDTLWTAGNDAASSSFLQSGIAAPLTSWTVATKLQEIEVSAGDSAAASVTAKIDAAITGAAGRIVWIPPTMGAGEATTYPVGTCVIDLRSGTPGSGGKIVPNFVDSAGHIRWLVIDDQTSPTLSANAAALFNHRPTGTLPNSSTGEGAHCVGQTTGALLNSPTGYTLSGVEGGVSIGSTGGTIPDAWGVTANSATAVSSTTNVTRLVSVYAQAPSKSGSGTITNAYTIVAEDPGSIASSDNLSLWAKGAVRIGPQGTGAVNATLVLDGSSASGQGAVLTLQRNGTPAAQVCTEGAIIGGGSANLYLNKLTSGNVKVGINSVDVAIFGTTGVQILSTVAIPAGGTAGTGYTFSSTSNFGVFFGSGAPALSAAKGSLYLRSNGTTTNDRAFINTDGGTTWTALTTAA